MIHESGWLESNQQNIYGLTFFPPPHQFFFATQMAEMYTAIAVAFEP